MLPFTFCKDIPIQAGSESCSELASELLLKSAGREDGGEQSYKEVEE